jgi:hypothetical protein
MKQLFTLSALIAASALVACGGSPSAVDSVTVCSAKLLPRVRACIPDAYSGIDASPLRECIAASPALVLDLGWCRDDGRAEFAAWWDYRVGHEARVLLEMMTD